VGQEKRYTSTSILPQTQAIVRGGATATAATSKKKSRTVLDPATPAATGPSTRPVQTDICQGSIEIPRGRD